MNCTQESNHTVQEMYYENECESESESKSTKYNEKVKCNFASMPIGEKLL